MKNMIMQILVLSLVCLFLLGCSEETNIEEVEDTETQEAIEEEVETSNEETKFEKSSELEVLKDLSKAIESGKPMRCTINYVDNYLEIPMEMNYWVKGNNMRTESNLFGKTQVVIIKDEITYTKADKDLMSTDCDWIVFDISERMEQEYEERGVLDVDLEFDISEFENKLKYDVKCVPESFGNEKFLVSGKQCKMQEIIEEMMKGLSFD